MLTAIRRKDRSSADSISAIFFFRFHPFSSFSRWIANRISLYSSKYPSLSTPYCWVNPGICFSLCSVTRLIILFVTPTYKVPFLSLNRMYV